MPFPFLSRSNRLGRNSRERRQQSDDPLINSESSENLLSDVNNAPEETSAAPERSDRTSRSHSRSPHRHRHSHHHSHRRRRFRFKQKERNFIAAICSMVVIVILCTAMAEPDWFSLRGGGCKDANSNRSIHSLGVYQFFYTGDFRRTITHKDSNVKKPADPSEYRDSHFVYNFSPYRHDVMIDCVTPQIVQVMRSIIALCFIGISFSLMGFLLDLTGPSSRMMKILRRNAVFNILTVVVCVTINGFSFLVTQLLESLQNATKHHKFSKVDIQFDVSFYLIAAAGGMSVIAAACNLLRRYPNYEPAELREHLLDDYDNMDLDLPGTPDYYAPMSFLPPPPAYTP